MIENKGKGRERAAIFQCVLLWLSCSDLLQGGKGFEQEECQLPPLPHSEETNYAQ
jgi:hypothetical protein